MPRNKTHDSQLRLFLSFSRRPCQSVTHDLRDVYDGKHCICSAQAILDQSRGEPRPLCDDLPWNCPFLATNQTPVE